MASHGNPGKVARASDPTEDTDPAMVVVARTPSAALAAAKAKVAEEEKVLGTQWPAEKHHQWKAPLQVALPTANCIAHSNPIAGIHQALQPSQTSLSM